MNNFLKYLFILLFSLVFTSSVFAQSATVPSYDPKKPIKIAADRMEADNLMQSVRFIGDVVAKQGDTVLRADAIVLRYKAPKSTQKKTKDSEKGFLEALPQTGGMAIESLVATGRVVMVQKKRRATCERAEYLEAARTITLSGNPELWQGNDFLKGGKIVVHLDSERVEVKAGKNNRVSAQIFPDSTKAMLDDKAKNRLKELETGAPPSPDDVKLEVESDKKDAEEE